ncbi:MAG TPA: hypothetical protein VMW42_09935 [Desulfatiglandales bacterium]|nr:hypothetical protein [Desulfatiglandales bacterium]
MNPKDKDLKITYDGLGTKYSCPICGFFPSRIECHIKGWGKSQHLKKIVRDHIKSEHPGDKDDLSK